MITRMLPGWIKKTLKLLRNVARLIIYYGDKRFCPICGKSSSQFLPFGVVPRDDAQCIHCGNLERHRFFWLFINEKTDLFNDSPKKMLHVAPEPGFISRFSELLGDNYLTADLYNPIAMVKMDITNIEYPDESFDVICCNHVLEHVEDDRKALNEFVRVLKSGGWAILTVPITSEKTFEDFSIVDPKERLKYFGKDDHVRSYGRDYIDRLREAGFAVEVIRVADMFSDDEAVRMGLTPAAGEICYCTVNRQNNSGKKG